MFFIRLVLGNSSDGYTVKADFKEPDSYEKKVSGKFTLNVKEIENLHTSDLEDLRVYGTKLGQAVFNDEVKTAFDNTLARLGNDVLHIAISVEDNDLRRLRWERLCYPKNESWEFLRLDQKTPFSIEIGSISNKRYPSISRVGLKALVVVADLAKNSYNLAPFDAHKTVEGIQNALGPSISSTVLASSGGIQLPNAHGLPTIEEICKWLSRDSFAIMHIVCHGVLSKITDEVNRPSEFETQLFLRKSDPVDTTREDSHVQRLSGKEFLTELSRQETKLPHLTFLCSCSSASPASTDGLGGLGQRMVRELGMRAVVAMTQPVRIDLATELSKNFYEHLRMTGEVDRSLNAATSSVRKSDGNVLVPTLFSCIGGRSLFVDNRELTTEEWEHGLKRVKPLVVERSPIRFSEFENLNQEAIVAVQILKNAGNNALTKDEEKAKRNLEKIIDELEPLCQDVIENSFEHLAKDKPLSNSKYCKNCPFPGLGFFDRVNLGDTEEDYRPFFFGRYDLSCKILDLLEKSRFLAVVGGSGTGKSSLLRAGAIVELERKREKKDITALFTPGTDPLFRIERALNSTAELELIVVDQFEELFTLCTEKTQKDFVAKLYEVTRRIPVLIALREDYLTQANKIEQFKELIEANDKNVMVLQSLDKSDLKRVVLEQLQFAELILDNGLIDTIFDELENPNAAMPLVQHFMRELWKRRHGRRLKLVEYAAIGGVNGAITKTAEDKYESLTREIPESKTILPFIFEKLTRIDTSRRSDGLYRDSRKPELLSELSPKGIDPNLTEKIVDSLVESKLLTINKNEEGEKEVELSHEPLLQDWKRLKEWITAARDDSDLIEKIVKGSKAFIKTGKKSGLHLREDDLKAASNLVTKVPCRLTDTQIDFVVKCRENQEQARKYWNIIRWSVSSVILCLAIWLGFSLRRTLIERARAQKGVVELGIASGTAQRDREQWIKSAEHFQKAAEASDDAIEREMLQIAANHLSTGITHKKNIEQKRLDGVRVVKGTPSRIIYWSNKGEIFLTSLDENLSITPRGSIPIAKDQDGEITKIALNEEGRLGLAIAGNKNGTRISKLFEITDNTIKDHGNLLSEDTIDAAFRSNRLATVSKDGDIKVFKVSLDNQIVRPQLIETTLKAKGDQNLEIDMNNEGIVLVNSDKGPVILMQEGNRLVDVTPEGQGNPSKQKARFIGAKQWVIWEGDSNQLHIYSFDLDKKTVKAVDVEGSLNGLWPQGDQGFLLQTNQAQKLYLHVDPENWAKGVEVPTDADLMGKVMSVHHMDFDPGSLTCFVQADKGIFLVTCELENKATPKVYKLSKRKELKYDAVDAENVFVGFENGLIDKQTRFGSEFQMIAEVTQGARVDGIVAIPNGLISWSKENGTIDTWTCQNKPTEKLQEIGAALENSLYIGENYLVIFNKKISKSSKKQEVSFYDISKEPLQKSDPRVIDEPIRGLALLCEGNAIALLENGDLSKISKGEETEILTAKFSNHNCQLRSRTSSDGKETILWSGVHWARIECSNQSSIKSNKEQLAINDVAILENGSILLCTDSGILERDLDGTSHNGTLWEGTNVLRISTTGKSAIIKYPEGKVEHVKLADPEMGNSRFLHKDPLGGSYDPIQRFLLDDDSVIAWSEKELYRWSKATNLRTRLWDRPEGESRGVIYATKKSTRYVIAWCGSQIRVIDSFNCESLMDFNERTDDNENIHECELIGDGPSFTARVDGGLYIHRLRPATLEEIQRNTNAAMSP